MDVKAFNDANEELKKELNEFRERSKKVFIAGVYKIHKDIISLWFSAPKYNLIGLSRRDGKAASSWHVIVNRGNENVTANIVSSGAPYVGAFFEDREIKPKQKNKQVCNARWSNQMHKRMVRRFEIELRHDF